MRARSAGLLLMVALVSAPDFAAAITIDPNDYGDGQVITAPGVTFETESLVQTGTDFNGSPGVPSYTPVFGSVYSYNVGTNCISVECPVVGTSVFAPSPSGALPSAPFGYNSGGFWGNNGSILGCSANCVFGPDQSESIFLRINFADPTNFVDALAFSSGGDSTILTAFDSAGNEVGQAISGLSTNPNWGYAVVATSTADISTVLIGGGDSYRQINEVNYNVPEINPATAAGGVTLLLGGLVVLRGRRRHLRGW
jgi:hypothetical protein